MREREEKREKGRRGRQSMRERRGEIMHAKEREKERSVCERV